MEVYTNDVAFAVFLWFIFINFTVVIDFLVKPTFSSAALYISAAL